MRGTILHPLNALKGMHPDVYEREVSKYADRLHVMQQALPTLGVAWNDVLHFSAVQPQQVKQALIESGIDAPQRRYYEINPHTLDPELTTIYLDDETESGVLRAEQFLPFDPDRLHEHALLPEYTKAYYREMAEQGKLPLRFKGVPHILHKGPVDVSGAPIITV